MAGCINKVILVGYLGADPEIRRLNSGDQVANFRIATSESWHDRNTGELQQRTEWHSIVIFNENLVKIADEYLKKGMRIYIEGKLQTRKWQDQNGIDRYTSEIVLQKYKGELQMLSRSNSSEDKEEDDMGRRYAVQKGHDTYSVDDDVPF